ncbi:MAG: hypothetical protein K8H88_12840 [Sandaracinaceae bacterium]|nr:hypothetical protein [Sandaracinaceae bacterium]
MSTHPPEGETARLSQVRFFLDEALVALRAIEDPAVPRESIEAALGAALQHAYGADAERGDWGIVRQEVAQAMDRVRESLALVQSVPTGDAAAGLVTERAAQALGHLGQLGFSLEEDISLPRRGQRKPLLRATLVEPALLDPERAILRPAIPLDMLVEKIEPPPVEVLPAPARTLDEVLALAEQARARLEEFEDKQKELPKESSPRVEPPRLVPEDEASRVLYGVAITEQELLAERARECLEDLSMLGRMRRPVADEAWTSGESSEARVLRKLDALAACGAEVWPSLIRALDDRPMPDPELTFGDVFFLCSIAGDDTFDEATRLARTADLAEPEMLAMLTDALVFARHPRIDSFMNRWLSDASADRRALAVEVLRRRGTLSRDGLNLAMRDSDTRVLASAARALTLHRDVALGSTGWFLAHPDEHVCAAAIQAALWLGLRAGLHRAEEIVREDLGDFAQAAMYVAISGNERVRTVLEEELATEGTVSSVRAMGWFGDTRWVPFLLGRLRNGADDLKVAALDALERLTGASLTEAVPEPEYRRAEEPFMRPRRDYEPVPQLLDDPDAWEQWWKRHGRSADPKKRYRWGHEWSAQDNLHELSHADMVTRDRPFAALELAARVGGHSAPLDTDDWVARQRRHVRQWREAIGSRATAHGWVSRVDGD